MKFGTIITLTGPSCSGKSTLEQLLVREPGFKRVISHTTRPIRGTELPGREYHFVSPEVFQELVDKGEFVEIVEFGGNRYGATRKQFLDIINHGDNAVVVVEPNGRHEIIQFAIEEEIPVLPVFVTNPTSVLAARFLERAVSDFSLALSKPGGAQKVLDTYAGRLDVMMSEERDWTAPDYPTAVTFGKFGADNQAAVLAKILQLAESCPKPKAAFE